MCQLLLNVLYCHCLYYFTVAHHISCKILHLSRWNLLLCVTVIVTVSDSCNLEIFKASSDLSPQTWLRCFAFFLSPSRQMLGQKAITTSILFSAHQSLIILSFYTTYSELLTALLYKPQIIKIRRLPASSCILYYTGSQCFTLVLM
jgi:hypothetical protein